MSEFLHGDDIGETLPPRFLTSHTVWDDFISQIWAGLLSDIPLGEHTTVLEIGPGVSTKIGGALARYDFCGQLYVVDPLEGVLDILKEKYQRILPQADITYIQKPLSQAYKDLPEKVDIMLGSHVLDDMMIYHGSSSALEWGKNYTHQPSADLKISWQNLCAEPDRISKIKKDVMHSIIEIYDRLRPSVMLLNQYPSATLEDHEMSSLNQHALDILKMVKSEISSQDVQHTLDGFPHYRNAHIANNVLNAAHWMLCKKK